MKILVFTLTIILSALPMLVTAAEIESNSAGSGPPRDSHDVDTRALIREVGAKTHKHFVWDPRVPQTVNLGTLNREEITYGQLLALLRVYGLAVIPDDNVVEVVPDVNVRFAAVPVVSPENLKGMDDEWVTVIVPVKTMSAVQLVTILRPLVPTTGQINAMADRNALIILDRSANLRRLLELTKELEHLPSVTSEFHREQ